MQIPKKSTEYAEETKKVKVKKKPTKVKKEKTPVIDVEEQAKEILIEEKAIQEIEGYKKKRLNWIDDPFYDSWEKVLGHTKKLFKHNAVYDGEKPEWFFLAHSKDTIVGKPQMIEDVKVRIPLIRLSVRKKKDELMEKKLFYLIGEKYDKRYDGNLVDAFSLDFYKYMIKTPNDERYFIFSETKLPNQTCTIQGMCVEMDDVTEMNNTMKIPILSKVFFAKDAIPDVKIITNEELVEFTKERKITEFDWLTYLATHRFGTINSFPLEVEMLKSAWLLSGKVDGWPLHLFVIGPPGTRKTMGWAETLSDKFSEDGDGFIMDSGNSTLKGLIPSYKGNIAEPGFLAKAERVAIVDEIMKLVEREMQKHESSSSGNILGEINPIMEHKNRKVYSGNTSECNMTATAKNLFIGNPLSNRTTIAGHVGVIDPSTMSRGLWWVQDYEEQKFVLGENGIIRPNGEEFVQSSTNPPQTDLILSNWMDVIENRKNKTLNNSLCIVLGESGGELFSRNEFLTIYDSCNCFVSKVEDKEIYRIIKGILSLCAGQMKEILEARAYHHIKLVIDGLCKHRCLFRDYDPTFTPKPEDYDLAERILVRMVKSWDTDLSPKREGWN